MIVFHAYVELAVAEPGLEALAGLRLTGAADRLAAVVEQDAVAAAERGQRADHVERLGQALQLLAAAISLERLPVKIVHTGAFDIAGASGFALLAAEFVFRFDQIVRAEPGRREEATSVS